MLPEFQLISGIHMHNTNNFPSSFEFYVANKPVSSTVYQWLTDPINQFRFVGWVIQLLYLITRLCKRDGLSYAFIRNIGRMVDKSERTTQRTLRRLTAIGVVTEIIQGNQRKYKVNWDLLRTKDTSKYVNNNKSSKSMDIIFNATPDVTPANFANTVNVIIYPKKHGYTNNTNHQTSSITTSYYTKNVSISDSNNINIEENPIPTNTPNTKANREEKNLTVKVDTISNLNNATKLDPTEAEIKQEFEAITGNKLNIKRDKQALKALKEISLRTKNIVLEAFRNVSEHLFTTQGKIYSLSYVLATAKNLLHNQARPKKDNLSAEDKRNLEIGGKGSRSEAATPDELKQVSQNIQAQLKNYTLSSELYDALPDGVKAQLIEEKIKVMKTWSNWEKIRPQYSWSYNDHIRNIAIDNIKRDLLQIYLSERELT